MKHKAPIVRQFLALLMPCAGWTTISEAATSDALGKVFVIGETGTSATTYTDPVRRLAALW